MNKKISLGAAIAFMLVVAALVYSVTMVYSMRTFNDKVYSLKERETRYSKIAEIDNLVQQNYIGVIAGPDLTDATAAGFIAGIQDKHAQYYDAVSYAKMMQDYTGKSVQIGIVTTMDGSGYMRVEEVYPDSPAQAAGIEQGDLIVKIEDTDITTDNYDEAVNMLSGEAGTKMTIILRKGVEDIPLDMTRRFVEVPSVSSSLLENQVGLLHIKEFNDNTPEQFSRQVDKLIDQGALGLVIDVRGVHSGDVRSAARVRSAAQVLDKLLPEGDLVSSADKNGVITVLETSDARQVPLPMAVLVNDKTSGEAELFAQAIRDYDKGRVIGVKTAGQGTIQTIFPLTDGSAIKITTARYQSKSGASFDGEGVKPDYEVKLSEEQEALAELGGIENDLQLKKAVEVVIGSMKAVGMEIETLVPASSDSAEVSSAAESRAASEGDEPQEESDANESDTEGASAAGAEEESSSGDSSADSDSSGNSSSSAA